MILYRFEYLKFIYVHRFVSICTRWREKLYTINSFCLCVNNNYLYNSIKYIMQFVYL